MPFFRLLKKLDTNECSSLTPGDLIAKEKKITPADKHAFDRALKKTTALKEVDLSYYTTITQGNPDLQADSLSLKDILFALYDNTSVKKADLSHNPLSEDLIASISVWIEMTSSLEEITLVDWGRQSPQIGLEGIFYACEKNTTLKYITLGNCYINVLILDSILSIIANNPVLEKIEFRECCIAASEASCVRFSQKLQQLKANHKLIFSNQMGPLIEIAPNPISSLPTTPNYKFFGKNKAQQRSTSSETVPLVSSKAKNNKGHSYLYTHTP